MRILVTANQKGGVGKSTLTAHLVYAAAKKGKRVLLVDLDPSGNLSLTFSKFDKAERPGLTSTELFSETEPVKRPEIITDKISLITSNKTLTQYLNVEDPQIYQYVRHWLRSMQADYDICLIDTPPTLSSLLIAGMTAADSVLTPIQVGLYEMEGASELFSTIKAVRAKYNPKLKHSGILLVKTNSRSREEKNALAELRANYGSAILDGSLPERAAVRVAVAQKKPVWDNVRGSSHKAAAEEWLTICSKIIDGVLK